MSTSTQLGPFGHQMREIAKASKLRADINRWNDYASALDRKLKAEARYRKQGTPAAAIMAGGIHNYR